MGKQKYTSPFCLPLLAALVGVAALVPAFPATYAPSNIRCIMPPCNAGPRNISLLTFLKHSDDYSLNIIGLLIGSVILLVLWFGLCKGLTKGNKN